MSRRSSTKGHAPSPARARDIQPCLVRVTVAPAAPGQLKAWNRLWWRLLGQGGGRDEQLNKKCQGGNGPGKEGCSQQEQHGQEVYTRGRDHGRHATASIRKVKRGS